MKIGILTYHRAHNYGALLQAIALRKVLLNYGHEVWYIDYWPEYRYIAYESFSLKRAFMNHNIKGTIKYIVNTVFTLKRKKRRNSVFEIFLEKNIQPYCNRYSSLDRYDVIVYGSDQIWRKQPYDYGKFDAVYYGNNILSANKHITYAASMGEVILSQKDKIFIKKSLKKFSSISVREDDLNEALSNLGIQCNTVLDPTLLLSDKEWENIFITNRPFEKRYVLYYRLMRNSFDELQIQAFAKKSNLDLVILDGLVRIDNRHSLTDIDPAYFLSLIKYADFIFTSSYHGLIFSLIYRKQFFASFIRNEKRARSLLNKVDLINRLILPKGLIPLNPDVINYKECERRIEELRKFSKYILSRDVNT